MACPSPSIQPGEQPPLGLTLQMASGTSFPFPDTQSHYLSCFAGCSITRVGYPWGSAFLGHQKVPASLFESLTPLSILPDLGGSCAGRSPMNPCSGSPRKPWKQLEPGLSSGGVSAWSTPEVCPVSGQQVTDALRVGEMPTPTCPTTPTGSLMEKLGHGR